MTHVVHSLQKRYPMHAGRIVGLLMGTSAALMAAGTWLLTR